MKFNNCTSLKIVLRLIEFQDHCSITKKEFIKLILFILILNGRKGEKLRMDLRSILAIEDLGFFLQNFVFDITFNLSIILINSSNINQFMYHKRLSSTFITLNLKFSKVLLSYPFTTSRISGSKQLHCGVNTELGNVQSQRNVIFFSQHLK